VDTQFYSPCSKFGECTGSFKSQDPQVSTESGSDRVCSRDNGLALIVDPFATALGTDLLSGRLGLKQTDPQLFDLKIDRSQAGSARIAAVTRTVLTAAFAWLPAP
jgi:hypothetical protein